MNAPLQVRYRAGTEIDLKNGFSAVKGSDFKAFIHPCDAGGNSSNLRTKTNSSNTNSSGNKPFSNDSLLASNKFVFYPIPANNQLFYQWPSKLMFDKLAYYCNFIDELGECVLQSKMDRAISFLNINSLPSGFYIVLVYNDNGTYKGSNKIVINK